MASKIGGRLIHGIDLYSGKYGISSKTEFPRLSQLTGLGFVVEWPFKSRDIFPASSATASCRTDRDSSSITSVSEEIGPIISDSSKTQFPRSSQCTGSGFGVEWPFKSRVRFLATSCSKSLAKNLLGWHLFEKTNQAVVLSLHG